MTATLREIKGELRRCMHEAIPDQGRWLQAVVRGFFAYHAVPINFRVLAAFRYHVTTAWKCVLRLMSRQVVQVLQCTAGR